MDKANKNREKEKRLLPLTQNSCKAEVTDLDYSLLSD